MTPTSPTKPNRRRLWILLAALLLILAAGAAVVLVRLAYIRREHQAMRQTGESAFKSGDYATAIENLIRYVNRYNDDPDALYWLAESRRRLPTPDGSHLLAAAQLYKRLLELRPTDDIRRELATLYSQTGFSNEAISLAQTLLNSNPKDRPALRAKVKGLAALRESKRALDAAKESLALDPLDISIQAICLELLKDLNRKSEILPHARNLLDKHPADGRAELLLSLACALLEDLPQDQQASLQDLLRDKYPDAKLDAPTLPAFAAVFARQAALRPSYDLDYAYALSQQFDRLSLTHEATSALERAVEKNDDLLLRLHLFRRLFAAGRYADLDKRLANVPLGFTSTDLEMLAVHAVALANLDRKPAAAAIADRLDAWDKQRPTAAAWSAIIRQLLLAKEPDALKVVLAVRAALDSKQTSDPYLRYYLGEAYALLGERYLAAQSYQQAAANRLWALPLMRLSRLWLDEGRPEQALAAARTAAALSPFAPARANFAAIACALANWNDPAHLKELLTLTTDVQQLAPAEEQTLPLHLRLLARAGQKDAALKTLRDILASTSPPSTPLLVRLAAVSRENKFDLEESLYALAEKHFGLTPELAFARAADLHNQGQSADGAKLLEDALRKQDPANNLAWRLAFARYLDETADPRAAQAWTALGDDPATPSNLAVQHAALLARSVQSDRQFLFRTLDRLRALTGEQAVGWRMNRARLLLRDDAPPADLPLALKLLTEVLPLIPEPFDARVLLAVAYERQANRAAAIEQLAAALKLRPDSDPLMLSLAKLHHAQSDFQRARELLDRIQPDRLTPEQRAQLARLFAQQGLTARAAALLESATVPTTNPADKLLLADLYRYRNQPEKAEQLFKELLKNPDLPTIIAAAGFYAANHRQSDADNALALLDSLKLEPGLRERALAEHHALYGATEKALEYARAATAAAPANPDAWRSLITLSLRSGLVPDALAAAAQAAKNLPAQTLFQSFVAQSDDIKTLASNPGFLPLVAAVFQTPDPAPVLEVIRAVADAVRTPQPPAALIAKLRPLADRSPSLVPLQVLLMHTCAAADRLEDAATLARRTLAAAPASPDAAEAAIRILAAAKDLPGALNAASRYRELTLNNPLKADALLAELHLRSGDLPAAQKQIAPYLPLAQANPDPYLAILIIQARIHLAQREPAKAADLLAPHLARSPAFRRVWLELSLALTTDQPDLAASWLQRISASMSNAAPEEFIALATAWQALAQLSADPKYIDQARALLTDLATRAEKPAPVYFSLGLLHANQRKFPEAEQFYRRALQLDPTMSTAQNNLAMVLYELNSNLDEAAALASKAVQAAPNAAPYHDTLGLILAKQGHTADAIATLKKAIDLDKFNPEWKLTLATLYHQTAQYPEAARLLAEIDALTRDSKNLPPDFRSRLTQLRMKLDAKLPR